MNDFSCWEALALIFAPALITMPIAILFAIAWAFMWR